MNEGMNLKKTFTKICIIFAIILKTDTFKGYIQLLTKSEKQKCIDYCYYLLTRVISLVSCTIFLFLFFKLSIHYLCEVFLVFFKFIMQVI